MTVVEEELALASTPASNGSVVNVDGSVPIRSSLTGSDCGRECALLLSTSAQSRLFRSLRTLAALPGDYQHKAGLSDHFIFLLWLRLWGGSTTVDRSVLVTVDVSTKQTVSIAADCCCGQHCGGEQRLCL